MQLEDDAVSCEGACDSADDASTGKDKHSTQEEMACMKNGVLTRFLDCDVGLPFGCPTVNY